jgi:hypothetical protein
LQNINNKLNYLIVYPTPLTSSHKNDTIAITKTIIKKRLNMAYSDRQLRDALYNATIHEIGKQSFGDINYTQRALSAFVNMAYIEYIQTHAGNSETFYLRLDRITRAMCNEPGWSLIGGAASIVELLGIVQALVNNMKNVRAAVNDDNVTSFTSALNIFEQRQSASNRYRGF